MNILIAEDELDLLELLNDNLVREGYKVYMAKNGKYAWDLFLNEEIDLCILDVMMPEMSGLELVQKIRERSKTPVIFLTARGDEMDRVLGLSLGGDDYLVKPFSMAELKARIQVQGRHMQNNKQNQLVGNERNNILLCGNLKLDIDKFECIKNGKLISLNAKEFLLLKFFMENQGRVFTKKQLYSAVWQDNYLYDDNTVTVHLSRLRSKIEDDNKNPDYLITIKGIGYKLVSFEDINQYG